MLKTRSALSIPAVVALLYFLALRHGAVVVVRGYRWEDTCWLLRLGEIISNCWAIPRTDPLTFTSSPPFVAYQWLSEVLFFQGYHLFGSVGLLIALGALATVALIVAPLRCCISVNAPFWWSIALVAVTSFAAGDRIAVRPEVFDWIFLVAWLYMLQLARHNYLVQSDGKLDIKFIATMVVTAALWCNVHNCFLLGLAIFACYCAAFLLADYKTAGKLSNTTKTHLIALIVAAPATLLNPYGAALLAYLPAIVTTPFNAINTEMQPLALSDLVSFPFVAFLLLLILAYTTIAKEIWRNRRDLRSVLLSPFRASSLILIVMTTAASFASRRYCSLASIIILFEVLSFITASPQPAATRWSSFWHSRRSFLIIEGAMLFLIAIGVWLSASVVKVTIPMERPGFTPPFKAVHYLATHHDGRRIFSGLTYGSILDWYVRSPTPSIFADSRLYEYNKQTFDDYSLVDHHPGQAQTIFDKYNIDWLILENRTPLTEVLKRVPTWNVEYEDAVAIVFKRTQGRKQSEPRQTIHTDQAPH